MKALRAGNYRSAAAEYAGIGERTIYSWMEKGAKAKKGPYKQFLQALKKAEADAAVSALQLVLQAAKDNWTAAAWWLERRYPELWGRRDALKLTGHVSTAQSTVDDATTERLLKEDPTFAEHYFAALSRLSEQTNSGQDQPSGVGDGGGQDMVPRKAPCSP